MQLVYAPQFSTYLVVCLLHTVCRRRLAAQCATYVAVRHAAQSHITHQPSDITLFADPQRRKRRLMGKKACRTCFYSCTSYSCAIYSCTFYACTFYANTF